jgi:UDP-glucose 4-epimerase
MRAAALGRGEPGIYNLAGEGILTMSDLADALGWHLLPVPEIAVDATAELTSRLPFMPPEAEWLQSFRVPTIMDTTKARKGLAWRPKKDARATLRETVQAARDQGLVS